MKQMDCLTLENILIYRTEENLGGKKLWRMNLTAELAKKNFDEWNLLQIWQKKFLANWTEFAEKTVALIPACISD